MTFRVNIKALAGLPTNLDRRALEFATAASYVAQYTAVALTEGLVALNYRRHQQIMESVVRYLEDAATRYAVGDARRVETALIEYRQSDRRAAARHDAARPDWHGQVPEAPIPPPDANRLGPETFNDTGAAARVLTPPPDYTPTLPFQPNWTDLLSPTNILRDAIWQTTKVGAELGLCPGPIDAFAVIAIPFVGDWSGLMRTADAYDSVALLLTQSADQVDRAGGSVPLVWTGNAADGCRANLIHFGNGLREGAITLHKIAAMYRAVVQGVQANAQLVAALLTSVADELVDGLLALEEAPIGLPYSVVSRITDSVNIVRKLVDLAETAVHIVRHGLDDVTLHRLGILTTDMPMPDMTKPDAVHQGPNSRMFGTAQ
jgi:hypothetical protein